MDLDFETLVGKVLEQHERVFPKATLEMQIHKLSEELNELKIAKTKKEKEEERGDVLYVACTLLRYGGTEGIFNYIMDTLYHCKSERVKARLRNTLYMTGCKLEARNNKGVYRWTGTTYERDR